MELRDHILSAFPGVVFQPHKSPVDSHLLIILPYDWPARGASKISHVSHVQNPVIVLTAHCWLSKVEDIEGNYYYYCALQQ